MQSSNIQTKNELRSGVVRQSGGAIMKSSVNSVIRVP